MIHPVLAGRILMISESIHKELGPMLPVKTYLDCIAFELGMQQIAFERDVLLPINYKNIVIDSSLLVNFIVDNRIILEIRTADNSHAYHKKHLQSVMDATGKRSGILLNFHAVKFSDVCRFFVS